MFRLGMRRPRQIYNTSIRRPLQLRYKSTKSHPPNPTPISHSPYRTPLVWTGWVITLYLVGHVFTGYFYSASAAYGISMLPTIASIGDWLVESKYYARGREVGVGDIIGFKNPVRIGEHMVKRIVAMPGDFVERDTPGTNGVMIQIPEGHCYVVGDNLVWSRDSRMFGALPLALVTGKIVAKATFSGWRFWNWFERLPHGLQEYDDSLD